MTYDDILAARNKRAADESGIAGRARKSGKRQKTGPKSFKSPKPLSNAPLQASGIQSRSLEIYCSILRF
ncbi:uncharacterized protein PV07_12829 [Cladophialophora immunda]|uniref:Uncharacterized protein n=1 Tax=Cladophialophora immunda TaxID=569365 RepID=A0A0D2BTI8_9EURO|nr:uncharacterized protein PV07_12829 [Cladophialophora immunda]KIW21740.1 hypothetical protein PV07_12829 [Cladophialophora immunda]